VTVLEVLKLAADHFQKHGSDSARLDAEVLLAHALGLRRLDLYLKFDRPLSELELSSYRDLTSKRGKGEPVAYLVGHKEFMGLDFVVTPAVLVPNPDTEVLVQRAVELAREAGGPLRIADVGTGSGCIAIAIAHYAPNAEVVASDVAPDALEIAAQKVDLAEVVAAMRDTELVADALADRERTLVRLESFYESTLSPERGSDVVERVRLPENVTERLVQSEAALVFADGARDVAL